MQIFKTSTAKSAIIGTYTLLLFSFAIAGLTLGRVILMPLAFSILLAFLLSPLVVRLEKALGRVLAVLLVIILMTGAVGLTGYALSREFVRFATDLPIYKTNIDSKINSLQTYKNIFISSSETINEFKSKLSGNRSLNNKFSELIDSNKVVFDLIESIFGSFVSVVVTTFLVILFVFFILIDKETLRSKIIRLIGQGRIGTTTQAISDASQRVSRYLRMLLIINIGYGFAVALGLYLLGIPNALLWGALATLLRFVPYVGAWIAAAVPIALSFAVSIGWLVPLFTISLFLILELVCANIFEPLLFGTSTGVSSMALIVAALFWTMLWGPMGLLLSTPLTVCLAVLGRYVPQLEFFSILLSDEEPLALYEEFYHRLLSSNMNEVMQLTDIFLTDKSLTDLYDTILIPVIIRGEIDNHKEILDYDQLTILEQNISEMLEDLSTMILADTKAINDKEKTTSATIETEKLKSQHLEEIIICVPARALRDELVGEMLTQLLSQRFYKTLNLPSQFKIEDILEIIKNKKPKNIYISVLSPSTIIQARYLSRKIRFNLPEVKIIVGLWSYSEDITTVTKGLNISGTNVVVTTLRDAIHETDTE